MKNFKHLRKEIGAIKATYYEEDNKLYFIFPDEPDVRDWIEAKKMYRSLGKQIFFKVLSPSWN